MQEGKTIKNTYMHIYIKKSEYYNSKNNNSNNNNDDDNDDDDDDDKKIFIHLLIYLCSFFFFCCLGAVLASSFWLANWTRLSWQDEQDPYNVYVYLSLAGGSLLSALCRSFLSFHGLINSSSNLHMEMLTSLLTAPIRFFDVNPAGRILNRFANDIGCMDEVLPYSLLETVHYFVLIISILVLVSVANFWVIGACVPFAFLSLYCSRRQIRTREIRRIEAITSSTVCAHVADTIRGITTVRVYKRQKEFLDSFYRFVISLFAIITSIRKYQPKSLMALDTLEFYQHFIKFLLCSLLKKLK